MPASAIPLMGHTSPDSEPELLVLGFQGGMDLTAKAHRGLRQVAGQATSAGDSFAFLCGETDESTSPLGAMGVWRGFPYGPASYRERAWMTPEPIHTTNELLAKAGGAAAVAMDARSVWVTARDGSVFRWEVACPPTRQVTVAGKALSLSATPDRVGELCYFSKGATLAVAQLSCGHSHVVAVDDRGRAFATGSNRHGQLGQGHCQDLAGGDWFPIDRLFFDQQPLRSVAAGAAHCVAVGMEGAVFSWGWNAYGQLGLGEDGADGATTTTTTGGSGTNTTADPETTTACRTAPVQLMTCPWAQRGFLPHSVACGMGHTLLLAAPPLSGLAASDDPLSGHEEPNEEPRPAALSTSVYAWGLNVDGQLGVGALSAAEEYVLDRRAAQRFETTPQCVPALEDRNIEQVSCGSYHSLARTAGGQVFSWGRGSDGQLGHGQQSQAAPRLVKGMLNHHRLKVVEGLCTSTLTLTAGNAEQVKQVDVDAVGLDFCRLLPDASGMEPLDPELDMLADVVLAVGFGSDEDEAPAAAPEPAAQATTTPQDICPAAEEENKTAEDAAAAAAAAVAAAAEAKEKEEEEEERPCARLSVHSVFVAEGMRCPGLRDLVNTARAAQLAAQADEETGPGVHSTSYRAFGASLEGDDTLVVDVPNKRPQEVRALLEFLYTGGLGYTEVEDSGWTHARLLELALEWKCKALAEWLLDAGEGVRTLDPRERPAAAQAFEVANQSMQKTDVRLVPTAADDFGGHGVVAQKAMLAARSEFFRSALCGSFSEAKSGVVVMEGGFSTSALTVLRDFLQTGKMIDIEQMPQLLVSCELIALADMCGIQHLKEQCEAKADRMIDDEHAVTLLCGAEMFRLEQLRDRCLEYVIDRADVLTELGHLDPEDPSMPPALFDTIMAKSVRFEHDAGEDTMCVLS